VGNALLRRAVYWTLRWRVTHSTNENGRPVIPKSLGDVVAKALRKPVDAMELTAAIKHAFDGAMTADESSERFVEALGLAALDLWSELPQEVQHSLFEQAVLRGHKSERDESLREQLAQFLHQHHERTAKRNAGQAGAV
jgi:hypothetical protein